MHSNRRDWLTFWERCQYRTYYWNIVVSGTFPFDMRRVHPWQQPDVAAIYDVLRHTPTVTSAVLFGSSITPFCNMKSDIDLAYTGELGSAEYEIYNLVTNGVDFLKLPVENHKLKENIEKGLRLL